MLKLIPTLQSQVNDHDLHYVAGCWKIALTRASGRVFYLTDAPTDLTLFDGATYKAASGVNPSAVRRAGDVTPVNMTARGVVSSDEVTALDLSSGLFDDALVDHYLVDTRYAWLYPIDFTRYRLSKVTYNGTWWDGELESVLVDFSRPAGDYYGIMCRVPVFSQKCGVDPDAYALTGTISTVLTTHATFKATSIPSIWQASNYGNDGEIEFTTGNNAGWKSYIKQTTYASSQLTVDLHIQVPYPLVVGDAFVATPGCNKQWNGHCRSKFNNQINFQGEPFIPGGDKVRRGLNIVV